MITKRIRWCIKDLTVVHVHYFLMQLAFLTQIQNKPSFSHATFKGKYHVRCPLLQFFFLSFVTRRIQKEMANLLERASRCACFSESFFVIWFHPCLLDLPFSSFFRYSWRRCFRVFEFAPSPQLPFLFSLMG